LRDKKNEFLDKRICMTNGSCNTLARDWLHSLGLTQKASTGSQECHGTLCN